MNCNRRIGVAAGLLFLLFASGCAVGRWQYVRNRPDETFRTKVTVHTEPTGAEVSIDGTYLGESPVCVPVMYPLEIKIYERRIGLPYPHVESKQLKTYVKNVFHFTAIKTGYREGRAQVTLRGNEEREITIKLEPKPR